MYENRDGTYSPGILIISNFEVTMQNFILKLTKNIFTFSVLLVASGHTIFANSNIAIAKSDLWQAPYLSSVKLSIQAIDLQALQKDCVSFRKQVLLPDGSLKYSSGKSFDDIRRLPLENSMDDEYVAYFLISKVESFVTTREIPEKERSKLPVYNQTSSVTTPYIDSLSAFNVNPSPDSLTILAVSVGQPPLPISLVNRAGNVLLAIKGRDTACDVIANKATISAQGKGMVVLPTRMQLEVGQFYETVRSQVKNILALKESDTSKAARLGYRLSSLIAPSSSYSADVEDGTVALQKILFNEGSLEKSGSWSLFNNESWLTVSGSSVVAPVNFEILNAR